MKPSNSRPSCEDVLDAFAVEAAPGPETLSRYLMDYPEYSKELDELSKELSRDLVEDREPLSTADQVLIQAAWQRHEQAGVTGSADAFASLSVGQLREIAKLLDVPRQIVTAFRERKVAVSSVPRKFLAHLALAMNTTIERLVAWLELPAAPSLARNYKAEEKPGGEERVSFERLLIEANIPSEKRAKLLAED